MGRAGLVLLALGGCQGVDPASPDRVEKDHAWQVVHDTSRRSPVITLNIIGDGGLTRAEEGRNWTPLIYVSIDCRFDGFGVEATWGGPWPATDSRNEGYDYSPGEMLVYVDGRIVWSYRGAGYSRPGMITAGDDLSEPGGLPSALTGARTLDIEARFDDGVTQRVRLDLSGAEDVSGSNLAQEQAIDIFARRCEEIRTGRLQAE